MQKKHQLKGELILDRRAQALYDWVVSLSDWQVDNFHMISGDASFRRYFRFHTGFQSQSFIAVDAPPETEKNAQFVKLSNAFRANSVTVPQVFNHDFTNGFLLVEDFGDKLFSKALGTEANARVLYQSALTVLPRLQKLTGIDSLQHEIELPEYDKYLLDVEAGLFSHWLLEVHLELNISAAQRMLIEKMQSYLKDVFFEQPQVGVHRDYHSRNLMLLAAGQPDEIRIGVIDFQDAVKGPLTYDMVSLLRDCYITWPDAFVTEQLQQLHCAFYHQYHWPTFLHWFDCTGLQRHLKAAGIFARLCHRDNKTHYIQDIPRTLDYVVKVSQALSQSAQLSWMGEFATFVKYEVLPALALAQSRAQTKVKSQKASKD